MVESKSTRERPLFDSKTVDQIKEAIAQPLIKGSLPSNDSIDQTIDGVKETLSGEPENKISDDIMKVLEASQKFLHDKNDHEKLQHFVKDVGEYLSENIDDLSTFNSDQKQLFDDARAVISSMKNLVLYTIASPSSRDILSQLVNLLQSTVGGELMTKEHTADLIKEDDLLDMSSAEDDAEKFSLDDKTRKSIQQSFKNILRDVSQTQDYSNMLHSILDIINYTGSFARSIEKDPLIEFPKAIQFYELIDDAKDIIGGFCGRHELDDFLKSFWSLFDDLSRDEEIYGTFYELYSYLLDTIDDPELLMNDDHIEEANSLLDASLKVISTEESKYHLRFKEVFRKLHTLMSNFQNDKVTRRLQASLSDLSHDLLFNSSGEFDSTVVQQSLIELKDILMPILKDRLKNMSLPKIEGSNDTYDYTLENMSFDALEILPDFLNIRVFSDIEIDLSKRNKSSAVTVIELSASDIKMSFNNMNFSYVRKKLPKIKDSGTANAAIAGNGLEFNIKWKAEHCRGKTLKFELQSVKCKIDELKIEILDSQHKIIDGVVSYVFPGYVKKMIAEEIVNKIKTVMEPVQNQLNDLLSKNEKSFKRNLRFFNTKRQQKERKITKTSWDRSEAKGKFKDYSTTNEEDAPLLSFEDKAVTPDEKISVDSFDPFDQAKDSFTQILANRSLRGASGSMYASQEFDQNITQDTKEEDQWDYQWNDIPYHSLDDEE